MAKASTSKVTSKGQVTVPEAVRRALGLAQGDRLAWEATPSGRVVVRKVEGRLSDLVGLLGKPRRSATLAEMDEAVRRRFRDRYARR
jgi:antitoxin PrlF